jgi:hypothetical protein
MSDEILIVRDGDGYRVLFGHLHLASQLSLSNEVDVAIKGEGIVKVVKTREGLFVNRDRCSYPFIKPESTILQYAEDR